MDKIIKNKKELHKVLITFPNGYALLDTLLGNGTYGQVYLGINLLTKEQVAIKVVEYYDNNESYYMKMMDSPYILKMYDEWDYNQKHFIALELCQETLQTRIFKAGMQKRIQYCYQILKGMQYLNSKNIIHRDLKLQNILIKDQHIKIADFGFARSLQDASSLMSMKCGTPSTMAPEIYFKPSGQRLKYNKKCDMWALGVILHEIIYLCHPFNRNLYQFKRNLRESVIIQLPKIEVIINKLLVYEPQQRISLEDLVRMWYRLRIKKHPHSDIKSEPIQHKNRFEKPIKIIATLFLILATFLAFFK